MKIPFANKLLNINQKRSIKIKSVRGKLSGNEYLLLKNLNNSGINATDTYRENDFSMIDNDNEELIEKFRKRNFE